MPLLAGKQQLLITALLAALMMVTRSPQLGGYELLHAGSWALFFAAGVYLTGVLGLPLLLACAFLADAVALGWGNIASYCLTPTYAMLLPAYASLWAAGRWYSHHHRPEAATLLTLAVAAFAGALLCEIFSSGSFYWLSGQFAEPTMAEFLAREMVYFPAYFGTMLLWLAAGCLLHVGIVLLGRRAQQEAEQASH